MPAGGVTASYLRKLSLYYSNLKAQAQRMLYVHVASSKRFWVLQLLIGCTSSIFFVQLSVLSINEDQPTSGFSMQDYFFSTAVIGIWKTSYSDQGIPLFVIEDRHRFIGIASQSRQQVLVQRTKSKSFIQISDRCLPNTYTP